jgi:hypothetical protein
MLGKNLWVIAITVLIGLSDAFGACSDDNPDGSFIVAGSTIFQRVENGSVRVNELPPKLQAPVDLAQLGFLVERYRSKDRIFSMFGIFDVAEYAAKHYKLTFPNSEQVIIEKLTYDLLYQFKATPVISENSFTDGNTKHTVVVWIKGRKKDFVPPTSEENLIALLEQTGKYSARNNTNLIIHRHSHSIFWPADYEIDSYIMEEGVSREYVVTFGDSSNTLIGGCELPVREVTVEDEEGNKEIRKVLTPWRIPVDAIIPPATFIPKNAFPRFRDLR